MERIENFNCLTCFVKTFISNLYKIIWFGNFNLNVKIPVKWQTEIVYSLILFNWLISVKIGCNQIVNINDEQTALNFNIRIVDRRIINYLIVRWNNSRRFEKRKVQFCWLSVFVSIGMNSIYSYMDTNAIWIWRSINEQNTHPIILKTSASILNVIWDFR